MNSDLSKIKPLVSLFLEGLMLVFIFVYSQGSIISTNEDTRDTPLKNMVSLNESAWRAGSSSESLLKFLPKIPVFTTSRFLPITTDTPILMCEALKVNSFERNIFYIIASDNVP